MAPSQETLLNEERANNDLWSPDKRQYRRAAARKRILRRKTAFLSTFFKLMTVIGLVYFFLVSIGMMGAAFKGYGKDFAEALIGTTSNPFIGLFIGILATSLVQSSSTTTSIAVGMVGAGVLNIQNTIPIIMGANIGTTVTNLLVSLGHVHRREEFRRAIAGSSVHDFFNVICVLILFPLELATGFLEKSATILAEMFSNAGGLTFTSPVKASTKPLITWFHDMLVGPVGLSDHASYGVMLAVSFVLMFACLFFIVKTMRGLVVQRAEGAVNYAIKNSGFAGILVGLGVTILVQSSSITTSLLVPLVASGIMTVEAVFPITMGANIGTTTTAILASFATGNIAAITVAFVHFLFNMIGVCVFYPIQFFRQIPIRLAKWLGEIAFRRRRIAVFYVFFSFFILPGLLVFIYEWLK